jgi:hypothetical protein
MTDSRRLAREAAVQQRLFNHETNDLHALPSLALALVGLIY